MTQATVLVFLSLFALLATAQVPANKSRATAKPRVSASEEATAAAQAAAIAQAAGAAPSAAAPAAAANPQAQTPAPAPAPARATAPQPVNPLPAAAGLSAAPGSAHDELSAEELAIAARVHQGHLGCELGATIRVEHDAAQPGYFHVQGKGFRYRMRPVLTSSGAIRLEDAKAGAVWLQLANKSMLMDQKKGRRVADECAHPEQLAYAERMKTHPLPKLFDTNGMGR